MAARYTLSCDGAVDIVAGAYEAAVAVAVAYCVLAASTMSLSSFLYTFFF
jgi:hypothetical protein